MNTNIVSTTELQRNIKDVLARLNTLNEPIMVIRDSQLAAVMLPFAEFKRLSMLEKEVLKEKMEKILLKMAKRNRNISDKEIDADIEQARRAIRRS
ncbi:type II toxin-antitoxin system Phd/YefM family antitoxin [Candidatus Gottesmanbacteria bacterium]|nr:type II toxin-antitoxin system Phd/YefM family antitoxin [Candidatus Gottesmanbacteria bacterium]